MKRGEILDNVKRTVTQDRNNRHGEPENSFPLIAKRWSEYLGVNVKASDVAEMMALFKDVRFHMQPENSDNKHDQIGYLAIACELRNAELKPSDSPYLLYNHGVESIIKTNAMFPPGNVGDYIGVQIEKENYELWQMKAPGWWTRIIPKPANVHHTVVVRVGFRYYGPARPA